MASFPSYAPSQRSFKPGTYPQRSYRSLAGVVVKRTFGNRLSQATLSLAFDNVADSVATSILNHYRTQTASNQRFKVGTTTMGGMDANLIALADGTADSLRWEYESPPEVQSIRPGVSSLTVSLLGEIRDPMTDDL